MLRKLFILAGCLCMFFSASAQLGQNREAASILYEKEWSTGPMIITPGFGLGWSFQYARYRKADRYWLYGVRLHSLKHPKEISLPNPNRQDPESYVFGKINSVTALKGNFGARMVLADRVSQNGVRINFNYGFGPVLGMIKPIYYDIETIVDGRVTTVTEKFNPEDPQKYNNIIGTASFTKGYGELGMIFGGSAKTSFSFEWGNYDYKFYSIETGLTVDAFPKDVPIFAFIDNQNVFVNLFLCFSFGNRN